MTSIKKREFHPYQNRYGADKTFERGLKIGLIGKDDEKLIRSYVDERTANRHLSTPRINKITSILVNWQKFIRKPYREISLSDIHHAVNEMMNGESIKGKKFKQNTKGDYIRVIKPFLLYLVENQYIDIPLKKLKELKSLSVDTDTTDPDEILTSDEIQSVIKSCINSRDRAIIATLYESGCRINELGALQWKDIINDQYGIKLYITDKKTKKRRYSRLTLAVPYLMQWKFDYNGPRNGNNEPVREAPVFITREMGTLAYVGYVRLIQDAAKRADIKKRVNPHIFRKSRITHLIADNYQESVVKQSMWGNLDTKMFRTYVKLSERDIDNEFLRHSGVETEEKQEARALRPVPCGKCHEINPPGARFCIKCGAPITKEAEAEVKSAKDEIRADPKYQAWIAAAKEDLGLK